MEFENDERLYRAVLPGSIFWRHDGTLTSAALKDRKGLSTDRQMRRPHEDCIEFMRKRLRGSIVSVSCENCEEAKAIVQYDKKDDNVFHTLILPDADKLQLTNGQAKRLAVWARIDYREDNSEGNEI